jgi:hypothetical protein
MAYPETLSEKRMAAIVSVANDIASEPSNTENHIRRMGIARTLLNGGGPLDTYITIDFAVQGYDSSTPFNDIKTRLSSLITNFIALGF